MGGVNSSSPNPKIDLENFGVHTRRGGERRLWFCMPSWMYSTGQNNVPIA